MALEMVTAEVPNEPGQMAHLTSALAMAGVEIRGFSCDVDHVHILTKQGALCETVMAGLFDGVKRGEVLDLPIEGRSGVVAPLFRKLAAAGVNINVAFGANFGRQGRLILQVSDAHKAATVLKAYLPDHEHPVQAFGRI